MTRDDNILVRTWNRFTKVYSHQLFSTKREVGGLFKHSNRRLLQLGNLAKIRFRLASLVYSHLSNKRGGWDFVEKLMHNSNKRGVEGGKNLRNH